MPTKDLPAENMEAMCFLPKGEFLQGLGQQNNFETMQAGVCYCHTNPAEKQDRPVPKESLDPLHPSNTQPVKEAYLNKWSYSK